MKLATAAGFHEAQGHHALRLSVLEGESRRGVGLPRPGLTIHRFWAGQAHAPTGFRWVSPARMENPRFPGIANSRIIRYSHSTEVYSYKHLYI